jgi:hypothetical protein
MRELYIEGVAIHGGPESCVGAREGVGEALTGVRVGWAIEPRNDSQFGVLTLSYWWKATLPVALVASRWLAPRGRRTWARTESPCARTGRSHGRPSW